MVFEEFAKLQDNVLKGKKEIKKIKIVPISWGNQVRRYLEDNTIIQFRQLLVLLNAKNQRAKKKLQRGKFAQKF